MLQATTRLELNVLDKRTNPANASEYAVRNNCPAVVTIPDLIAPFAVDRAAKRGLYKIIAALDFPSGRNFAMQKLRDLSPDAMAADGFDILCSVGRTPIEALNEVKSLTEFINKVNPLAEIRWVLNGYERATAEFEAFLTAIQKHPCSFIRVDFNTDRRVTLNDHNMLVGFIRQFVTTPIKLSGSVNAIVYNAYKNDRNVRFDVTIDQAISLVRALQDNGQKTSEKGESKPEPKAVDGEKVIGTLGQDV